MQAELTILGNWKSFLRIEDNKTKLFANPAEQVLTLTSCYHKIVISTISREIVCNKPKETSKLSPNNHEGADTRMLLHAADLVNDGIQRIIIRNVDTDVVVIAISVIHKLDISSLWIALRIGKNYRYIFLYIRLLSSWVHISLAPFYSFMRLLVATKCLHSVIMARKLHVKHGQLIMK